MAAILKTEIGRLCAIAGLLSSAGYASVVACAFVSLLISDNGMNKIPPNGTAINRSDLIMRYNCVGCLPSFFAASGTVKNSFDSFPNSVLPP